MARQKLTQKFVDSVTNKSGKRKVDYFDTELTGLLLEVRDSGRTFYLRYRNRRGKPVQKKLADAAIVGLVDIRKLAQEKLVMIAMGRDPFEEKKALRDVPTVAEFVADSYMPHVKGYKRSWDTDECLLRNHVLPAIGSLHLDEVNRRHMVKLFSDHRETHKPGSTNRIIILCRYIFNLAIKWEAAGATANPTSGIPLYPENNKRERYLSEDEAAALFNELEQSENTQLKYIVGILLLTGARKREVLDAKWTDFNLDTRIWTIHINKTGRPRHIPISDGLQRLLERLPRFDNCEWLVPNPRTGKPFVSVFGAWNTVRTKAGLPEVRIHDLRHSFASFLINSGRSLYEVQKILGHTQVKTTQRYAHLSQDSLREAANTAFSKLPDFVSTMPNSTEQLTLVSVR